VRAERAGAGGAGGTPGNTGTPMRPCSLRRVSRSTLPTMLISTSSFGSEAMKNMPPSVALSRSHISTRSSLSRTDSSFFQPCACTCASTGSMSRIEYWPGLSKENTFR
jgi:hypothetical protein